MSTRSQIGQHHYWGNFLVDSQLPNVLGATVQNPALQTGDVAYVTGTPDLYVCTQATLGAAIWQVAGSSSGGGGASNVIYKWDELGVTPLFASSAPDVVGGLNGALAASVSYVPATTGGTVLQPSLRFSMTNIGTAATSSLWAVTDPAFPTLPSRFIARYKVGNRSTGPISFYFGLFVHNGDFADLYGFSIMHNTVSFAGTLDRAEGLSVVGGDTPFLHPGGTITTSRIPPGTSAPRLITEPARFVEEVSILQGGGGNPPAPNVWHSGISQSGGQENGIGQGLALLGSFQTDGSLPAAGWNDQILQNVGFIFRSNNGTAGNIELDVSEFEILRHPMDL